MSDNNTPPPPPPPGNHAGQAPPPPPHSPSPYGGPPTGGYAGPAGAGIPVAWTPIDDLAKRVEVTLWVITAVAVISMPLSFVSDPGSGLNGIFNILSWITIGVTIASGVLTIMWLYRLTENARMFSTNITFGPMWAIFGWLLIPFVWIMPSLQLNEQWKINAPNGPAQSGTNWKIWAWFACGPVFLILRLYTVGSLVGDITSSIDDAQTQQDLERVATDAANESIPLLIIGEIPRIVAAVLFIFIVRELTARQEARRQLGA